VRLGEKADVKGLAEEIMRMHPGLRKMQRSVRFSVNAEVVGPGKELREGDEVGVLPTVAGG
jgi:molybdopterin converting factor small subunit